jgi:protocatechuate 3,4-dioxygenase beta subunit
MAQSDEYAREDAGQPPSLHPPYKSTALRSPSQPLVRIPQTLTETTGPDDWARLMGPARADLTAQHAGVPQGQRIIVAGRVLDARRRPVPNPMMEIWQANAPGRYIHA